MVILKHNNKMKIQKFESFYKTYALAKTEKAQYSLLKDFTLSLSLDELLTWNDFVYEKWQKAFDKLLKNGLTDEDRAWFSDQFAQFDVLEASFKTPIEQRKAA